MPGRQEASSDLPDPGGPLKSRLCPPAAATSSARLALSCPLFSDRQGPPDRFSARAGSGGDMSWVPRKWLSSVSRSVAADLVELNPRNDLGGASSFVAAKEIGRASCRARVCQSV